MKFKKWVTNTLLVINALFIILLFADPIFINLIGIVGSSIITYLLTRYSKICNYERR